MAAAPAAALAGAAAAPAAPCAAPAPSPAVRLLKAVSSSPLARRSLLLLRIVVPAAALYGAAVIWFSAEGDTPLRRAAIAVAGLVEGAEAATWLGLRGAACAAFLVPLYLVAIMIGVSAGVDASWWQAIVVMSIGLWLGVRWSPSCCGAAPTCCCACCPRAWRALLHPPPPRPARRPAPPAGGHLCAAAAARAGGAVARPGLPPATRRRDGRARV